MINGIINVYKEKGFTSFDVVAKMRGIFHQRKIGHTGTLDPDAEGVLPVCLGKATKVCDLLTDKDKEYEAVLLLGIATDTEDITGHVLQTAEVAVAKEQVEEVISSFIGTYEQVPPMYSALKVQGQKLCDLARKGITIERKSRTVTIYDIEILEYNLPEVRMRVHCSKGTYIRTLCKDIGEKLGCFGCMKSLLRTRVSDFSIKSAHKLSELENIDVTEILLPVDTVFLQYPKAVVNKEADKLLRNGNRIPEQFIYNMQEDFCKEQIRIYSENKEFIGLYSYQKDMKDFKPIRIFME